MAVTKISAPKLTYTPKKISCISCAPVNKTTGAQENRSNYIDVTFKHAGGMFPTFFKI